MCMYYILYIHIYIYCIYAAVPDQVPSVMMITDSITLDDDNVTLTLNWGEPFNNFDPIVNYTVSCSGDVTCPPNFTTTDNTTRSYTITNLTPMTNYTFSVLATNSIGSGKAGVVMITTPSCKLYKLCMFLCISDYIVILHTSSLSVCLSDHT